MVRKAVIIALVLCLALAQEAEEIVYEDEVLEPLPVPPVPEVVPEQPESMPVPPPARETFAMPAFRFDLATLKVYQNEVLAVLAILVYLLAYLTGKRENVKLMERFYRRVAPGLEANFSHVGFSKTSGEAPFNGESPSQSTYYASGRDNVEAVEMRFNTKKRQDLLYRILDIFMPEKDTVTFDLAVKTDLPLVLAVTTRKQLKELTDKHLDLRTVTKQFKVPNLPANFEVLGEAADTVENVVDRQVVKKIKDIGGLLLSVHYTDLKTFSDSTGHLRVVFNLAHKQEENFALALELVLYLADRIAGLKLTANAKAKALKSREAYNQSKEKEQMEKHRDELRKKKEDKLRQEEAWLRSLPPEKQKKEEEKRKKKEFNKLTKGKAMKM